MPHKYVQLLTKGRNKCYTFRVKRLTRTFVTAWFAKAASKANIANAELCLAIEKTRLGQCVDLGGGVFKRRLNKNKHRSIIVANGDKYWVYVYLFAKKDRENIDDDELKVFRELADLYKVKTDEEIKKELEAKALVEICHG